MSDAPKLFAHDDYIWRMRDRAVLFGWDTAMTLRLAEMALPENDPHRRFLERLDAAVQTAAEAFDQQFEQAAPGQVIDKEVKS